MIALPHSSQLDRRDRHFCHVALCDPARLEGEKGAGNPPELIARRLVGLVDDGRWSRGRVKFRFGFDFECGSLDVVEEVRMCRFTWSLGEVRLASAQGRTRLYMILEEARLSHVVI
jgi:hypothetical protein